MRYVEHVQNMTYVPASLRVVYTSSENTMIIGKRIIALKTISPSTIIRQFKVSRDVYKGGGRSNGRHIIATSQYVYTLICQLALQLHVFYVLKVVHSNSFVVARLQ